MATSYMKYPMKCLDHGYYELAGSFQCNAAGGPLLPAGAGFVATRTAAGVYLVTLSEHVLDIISADATLQLDAGAAQYCQIGDIDATVPSVVIRIPGGADVAADANNRVNFSIVCKWL